MKCLRNILCSIALATTALMACTSEPCGGACGTGLTCNRATDKCEPIVNNPCGMQCPLGTKCNTDTKVCEDIPECTSDVGCDSGKICKNSRCIIPCPSDRVQECFAQDMACDRKTAECITKTCSGTIPAGRVCDTRDGRVRQFCDTSRLFSYKYAPSHTGEPLSGFATQTERDCPAILNGNPNGRCDPTNGECVDRCDPNPCAPGQNCLPDTGACVTPDPCANITCTGNEVCDPSTTPGTCSSSVVDGRPGSTCDTTSDCLSPMNLCQEISDTKMCTKTCAVAADCTGGTLCVNFGANVGRFCVRTCETNEQCESPLTCAPLANGTRTCLPYSNCTETGSTSCTTDANCTAGGVCENGACRCGEVGDRCADDGDCADGGHCNLTAPGAGDCRRYGCGDDAPCPDGQVCEPFFQAVNGQTIPVAKRCMAKTCDRSQVDGGCTSDRACNARRGAYRAECNGANGSDQATCTALGADYQCLNYGAGYAYCFDGCTRDSDCQANESCEEWIGGNGTSLGLFCSAYACEAGVCNDDQDCAQCATNDDCAPPSTCQENGFCLVSCLTDAQCSGGLRCNGTYCTASCTTDDDCDAALRVATSSTTCESGLCRIFPRTCDEVARTCSLGCNDDADCRSGESCDLTRHQCQAACGTGTPIQEDCGSTGYCSETTQHCESDCNFAGCGDGLQCDTASGECVQCTSPDHCAAVANGTKACNATTHTCEIAMCDADYEDCDGVYSTGCEADLTSEATCHDCGVACEGDLVCGAATCECASGTQCGTTCVADTDTDPDHCGGCAGAGGAVCDGGNAEECCAGTCVDTTSTSNCGGCNIQCRDDEICGPNGCGCPGIQIDCAGICTDTQTDPANCGGCVGSGGAVCDVGNGQACVGGSCQ